MLPGRNKELATAGYQHIYQSNVEQLKAVINQISMRLEPETLTGHVKVKNTNQPNLLMLKATKKMVQKL